MFDSFESEKLVKLIDDKKKHLVTLSVILGIVFIGCKKEKEDTKPPTPPEEEELKIGQSYQGGIIFYIDKTGKHGMVAAPNDQSVGIQWYNGKYFTIGDTYQNFGSGKHNTDRIVEAQGGGNYAAKICKDLVLNGYNDWFLPNTNELVEAFARIGNVGNFSNSKYWTSSEVWDKTAAIVHFGAGGAVNYSEDKANENRVRAVRNF
ncbi:MAG: DUF1566 domain-containing protein [Lentimicrobiaceae bacterium]|nr:DUF1566 domain-containing protein [Lentimicrobiaceae bacterium]